MSGVAGDVVIVDMGLPMGYEQTGVRPAVFLHAERNVSLVSPLSSNPQRLQFNNTVPIEPDGTNGLEKKSVALVFQMRAIDSRRIIKSIGTLSKKDRRVMRSKIRAVTHM